MNSISQLLQPMVAGNTPRNSLMQNRVGDELYTTRIFNIISDLAIIKSWMKHPDQRSNWQLSPELPTIFRYYALLESPKAQSFMILEQNVQQVQIDLRLAAEGLLIDYCYLSQYRAPHVFSHTLRLLNRYIDSFDPLEKRLLTIPAMASDTVKEAVSAGFIPANSMSNRSDITLRFPD